MNEVWKKPPIPLDDYLKLVGHEVGVSSWHLVDRRLAVSGGASVVTFASSCPALCRASTSFLKAA
ncbi:MAG: hypothetical protein Q8K88_02935 [Bradyrhizobium sp.]|nr:hypothetical protein [Bradyrhizobium sp.]